MKKVILAIAFAALVSGGFAPVAFAQVDPEATTTVSHSSGGNQPIYFLIKLGITNVSNEVAIAAWNIPAMRQEILHLWRLETFGYDNVQ